MLIGVYHHNDSYKTLPLKRRNALAEEALRQKVPLIFFGNEGVDFEQKKVTGKMFLAGKWLTFTRPFPDVLINEFNPVFKNRTDIEKKLRKFIPVTNYLIDGKLSIYEKLLNHNKFRTLVIPSVEMRSVDMAFNLFKDFDTIVVKPTGGRQGKGIYFIEKLENDYCVKEHETESLISLDELEQLLKSCIADRKHIAQPYINCRTSNNEPFDFRIHVQRDGNGEWQVTKVYPRIGSKDSILSNISRGGRTEVIESFLNEEFPEVAEDLLEILKETGIEIAEYINTFYKNPLDELGIDLAIDNNMKMWLYEINTGPQTRFHEKERAVNTIAYAKYVAEQNLLKKSNKVESQDIDENKKMSIGFLSLGSVNTPLKMASAYAAAARNIDFFYFTPKGIDYENKRIKAYQVSGFSKKEVEKDYPDVIIDILKGRGNKKYQKLYQEFFNIPMTNRTTLGIGNKQENFNKLSTIPSILPYLILTETVSNTKMVIEKIGSYEAVVMKPSQGLGGSGVLKISKNNGYYDCIIGGNKTSYDTKGLEKYLEQVLERKHVLQPFITSQTKNNEPFDVRVHLMKDAQREWRVAGTYVRVGSAKGIVSNTSSGGYIELLEEFIPRQGLNLNPIEVRNDIERRAISLMRDANHLYDENLSDVGLDFAWSNFEKWYLFEINTHSPVTTLHEQKVGKYLIEYASSLNNEEVDLKYIKGSDIVGVPFLSVSNGMTVKEAYRRGVTFKRLPDKSFQMIHGDVEYTIRRGLVTPAYNSSMSRLLTEKKDFTNELLRNMGFSTPEGSVYSKNELDKAWEWAKSKLPVVVKPNDGIMGKLVFVKLNTYDEFKACFNKVAAESNQIMVEEFVEGQEFRFTFVTDRIVAVAKRVPANVVGDSVHTVRQLIRMKNDGKPEL